MYRECDRTATAHVAADINHFDIEIMFFSTCIAVKTLTSAGKIGWSLVHIEVYHLSQIAVTYSMP